MRSPRLARAVLRRALPEDVREHIVEDLDEVFRRRVAKGRLTARLWYWREALSFGLWFMRERVRDAGPVRLGAFSWIDAKLGARIMMKHPGITVVGVVGMAVAIALAAGWWEFSRNLYRPELPIDAGQGLVRIQNWNVETNQPERRLLHDFETWRREVRSIEGLSAAATADLRVRDAAGRMESVEAVRLTPSAFELLGTRPLLGRLIDASDVEPGAPPVVLIGHGLWQRMFAGDPGIVGREIRVGRSMATVIGVMPEHFGFPVNEELWLPFGDRAVDYARGAGPAIVVLGRLAPGATDREAQAELDALGVRAAADHPETHASLRPRVGPLLDLGSEAVIVAAANVVFVLLLLVVCANVGTLVFARTITRQGEIALRTALGASRGRILVQLFTEALVLTALAAAVGLAVAGWGYGRAMDLFFEVQEMRPPFWFRTGLSWTTVLYVVVLSVLAAVAIGVLPALRATGRQVRAHLGAGAAQLRFGVISTTVIVLQVALCVALLPLAVLQGRNLLPDREAADRFPAGTVLAGLISLETDTPPGDMGAAERAAFQARVAELREEVRRRLDADPGIAALTFADRLPGMNHPANEIVLDATVAATDSVRAIVRTLAVDVEFFDALNAGLLAGRGFRPSDLGSAVDVVITGRAFADAVLGGTTAVGRRIRYSGRNGDEAQRWYEIVGVVEDPAMIAYGAGEYTGLYRPLNPRDHAAVQMFVRAAGQVAGVETRIREVVTNVDADLVVDDLRTMEEVWRPVRRSDRFFIVALSLVCAMGLVLSLAGIHALMSFTVAQRAREIAIRAALGAHPHRLIRAIFSRALLQIGLGVLLGSVLISLTALRAENGAVTVAFVALLMFVVGLAACALPARRALRIEPADALREGG